MSLKRKSIISNVAAAAASVTELIDDNYDVHVFDCCCETLEQNILPVSVACPAKLRRTYVQGFVHNVVPNYNLCEFKQHFRMSRYCYEVSMRQTDVVFMLFLLFRLYSWAVIFQAYMPGLSKAALHKEVSCHKTKSLDGTKPNTNLKTNHNPKLTLFSCFMVF